MGRGHLLCTDGPWLCVCGRHHGLAQPQGAELAGINTMDADFCVEALEEAISRYGTPEIFNTDQGAQFTSEVFTGTLKAAGIRISMDGKGRWVDNVFVERLWRSLKYEEVYLKAYETVAQARQGMGNYFRFYNRERRHQGLDRQTPDQVYERSVMWPVAA
jgi:putative transposase